MFSIPLQLEVVEHTDTVRYGLTQIMFVLLPSSYSWAADSKNKAGT